MRLLVLLIEFSPFLSLSLPVAPFTLAFECGFNAPISRLRLCVNLSEAARGEICLITTLTQINKEKFPTKQCYMTKQM